MAANQGAPGIPPGSASPHREIFIIVNDQRVGPFTTDDVTGSEIKAKAGLALTSDLFEKRGHELIPVENAQHIEIHQDEVFVDLPPTPVS